MEETLLTVRNLEINFKTTAGKIIVTDDINFDVRKGEVLGIVGESGCGKTVTSLAVMGLLPHPQGYVKKGEIEFKGENILKFGKEKRRFLRGAHMSMIFQEPTASLNPVYSVGDQISEMLTVHRNFSPARAKKETIEFLQTVGIPQPEKRFDSYPHQLSGGMCQRVMIAMALILNPELLIADEPTTALDVTIQAQILKMMRALRENFNTSIILISHDMGIIAEMADEVAVMYVGQIVERSDVFSLFDNPLHPYTRGLLSSIPRVDKKQKDIYSIPGNVPHPGDSPQGCRFHPRCGIKMDICESISPGLIKVSKKEHVRCWQYAK